MVDARGMVAGIVMANGQWNALFSASRVVVWLSRGKGSRVQESRGPDTRPIRSVS